MGEKNRVWASTPIGKYPQTRRWQQQNINDCQEKSIDKSILGQKLRIMKFYFN